MKGCEPDENEKCESSSYSPAAHSRNGYRVSVVKMKEPEYEKEGLFVDNGVVAYYNMTETGVAAYASAPASVLIEEEEGQSEAL